jgi:hypothetical protein
VGVLALALASCSAFPPGDPGGEAPLPGRDDVTRGFAERGVDPRSGVDLFLAANERDDGSEPGNLLGAHWESPDIKIDSPPYQPAPTTSEEFDALVSETFVPGRTSRVYVRVRNRLSQSPEQATVSLFSTGFRTLLPALPHQLGGKQESSRNEWNMVESTKIDVRGREPVIVAFDVPTPPDGSPHQCLVAAVDATGDPLAGIGEAGATTDQAIVMSNNIVARNMELAAFEGGLFKGEFVVANPASAQGISSLSFEAPRDWDVSFGDIVAGRSFELDGDQLKSVELLIRAPENELSGSVRITQHLTLPDGTEVVGGVTLIFERGD